MPQAMPRRGFLGVSASAALSAARLPHSRHRVGPPAAKPSFVFILIDDMGWADVGCNGSSFYDTPNIDRLAVEGIRFTNAIDAVREPRAQGQPRRRQDREPRRRANRGTRADPEHARPPELERHKRHAHRRRRHKRRETPPSS